MSFYRRPERNDGIITALRAQTARDADVAEGRRKRAREQYHQDGAKGKGKERGDSDEKGKGKGASNGDEQGKGKGKGKRKGEEKSKGKEREEPLIGKVVSLRWKSLMPMNSLTILKT